MRRGGPRGTTNRNARGNTRARRARRAYLLKAYEAVHGPGYALCYRCGLLLDEKTLTVDRIIPGSRGGTYRRNNIRPACGTCNSATAKHAWRK